VSFNVEQMLIVNIKKMEILHVFVIHTLLEIHTKSVAHKKEAVQQLLVDQMQNVEMEIAFVVLDIKEIHTPVVLM
jgi:hypothetical protein